MPVSVRCVNPKCGAKLNVSEKVDRSRAHCPKCGQKLPSDEDLAAEFLAGPAPPRRTRHTFEQEDRAVFEKAEKVTIPAIVEKKAAPKNGCLRAFSFAILLVGTLASVVVLAAIARSPNPGINVVVAASIFAVTLLITGILNLLIRIERNTRG